MNIVWFTWKDINHPQAGGAENVSWRLMQRLVKQGHDVQVLTARYPGSTAQETIDGIKVTRVGNRYSVYLKARAAYKKLANRGDLLVDEMNTIPFCCAFYSKTPAILLTYQLARSVWFYQAAFPISVIGYLLEPLYLFALSRKYPLVATESNSTKQDLRRFGFKNNRIEVFRVGIDLPPLNKLPPKKKRNEILVLGAMRPMKRTLDAVKGFEAARSTNPELTLTIAGDKTGRYAEKVIKHIQSSPHSSAISVLGRISSKEKLELMRRSSVILVTSIKEGWGLIVTEANSQGTPAIVYDCDGLRDSVKNKKTGLLVESGNTLALGESINQLATNDTLYQTLRESAWESSKQYTHQNSFQDFAELVGLKKPS